MSINFIQYFSTRSGVGKLRSMKGKSAALKLLLFKLKLEFIRRTFWLNNLI